MTSIHARQRRPGATSGSWYKGTLTGEKHQVQDVATLQRLVAENEKKI
jgi:hypothetical protein